MINTNKFKKLKHNFSFNNFNIKNLKQCNLIENFYSFTLKLFLLILIKNSEHKEE